MRPPRIAKLITGVVVALAIAGVGSAAGAQSYPGPADITLSTPSVPQGGTVTVTCTGFMPGSDVDVILQSDPVDLGTGTADGNGDMVIDVVIPPGTPLGAHTVTCTGQDADGGALSLTAELTVTGTAPVATGSLPRTGTDSTNLLRIGVVLIVAGTAIAVVVRRRKRDSVSA